MRSPTGGGDVCFLVRKHGRLWLATAKHALKDKADASVYVPWNLETQEALPLVGVTEPESRLVDDDAFADVALFSVGTVFKAPAHAAIDLDRFHWVPDFGVVREGDRVVFAGFPRESLDNDVDYEARHIKRQRFVAHARYVRPDASTWLHTTRSRTWAR